MTRNVCTCMTKLSLNNASVYRKYVELIPTVQPNGEKQMVELLTRAPSGEPQISAQVVGTHTTRPKDKNQGERVSSWRQQEAHTSDDPVQECEHCWQDPKTWFRCVHEFSEREMFACLTYVDPREESNSPEHMGATR